MDLIRLKQQIQQWGQSLGFQQLSVSDVDLSEYQPYLTTWLENHFHGDMNWMAENVEKRCHPEQLHDGTLRVITARMDYQPEIIPLIPEAKSNHAQISCYAHGRDYHKTIRSRLKKLAEKINDAIPKDYDLPHNSRAFVDSAPVLERALAEKSGLGWIGKNTMLINKDAGSWFFLGELFTNIPLPIDTNIAIDETSNNGSFSSKNHCGTCTACMDSCPTDAIIGPYQVDARRCISYLTIEHKGSIPEIFREKIGNRIFGCDDCQVVCPWNKFSTATSETDFTPRKFTQNKTLRELFMWSENKFLDETEGTPLRRVGYERWLRNIAVALGNAEPLPENINALTERKNFPSLLVQEHVEWALNKLARS